MPYQLELFVGDRRFLRASFGWSLETDNDPRVLIYDTRSEANEARERLIILGYNGVQIKSTGTRQ